VDRTQRDELHRSMVRLADGDRDAFLPVYESLWPVLRRFTERAMGGTADADDAAQVALTNVFFRASEFDAERDALSWVLGIAAYECRTLRAKRRRRREDAGAQDDLARVHGSGPNPEESVIASDLQAAMLDVLGTLREADVETLRLVAAGERPGGATFRKRVERAVSRLRTAWRTRHGTQ
jgi:DNA-directed RNA polymerase specialized sigma24 family protein